LNPGFFTKEVDDPVLKEIQRLYEIDKDTNILPGTTALTSGKFTENKTNYTMTAKEFEQFNKVYGDALQNGYTKAGTKHLSLKGFVESPYYKNKTTTDTTKKKRITSMYDKAYELAKKDFFKRRELNPQ
jgi:hypothetical protein